MGKCSFMDKHMTCPYFRRFDTDGKTQIVCEGVDGASSSRMSFSGIKQLKEYAMSRCASDYCLCVLCRGLNEFYEGE